MDAQIYNRFFYCFHLLLVFVFSLNAVHAAGAEPEPKKQPEAVYVAVEEARLYAGPSSDFYPTGDAKRGTVLEVYHRTDNGWLGVRPPQGSFSWVPASQAYLLPGGRVIEITDANSVSWIGTELGSAKQYRWQVQLKVGEQLTLLGEATIKSETDDREALWYKVSPPAGEFRWIEQAAVSKSAPPVKPTAEPSESMVEAKDVVPESAEDRATRKEASIVEAKKHQVESGAVQSASFEKPAGGGRNGDSAVMKSTKANEGNFDRQNSERQNSDRQNASWKHTPRNQWDGWYAFEMNEQGVRTPFLDKLSGRDRGQATKVPRRSVADPLMNDPFSLSMAGEPQKKLNESELQNQIQSPSQNKAVTSRGPMHSELNSVSKKQREWRDPRSIRDARVGSPESSLESMAARRDITSPSNSPGVQLASSDNLQIVATGSGVNTAAYERNDMQPANATQADPRSKVNWYGLAEGSSSISQASPNTAPSVVTSAADVGELQLALNNAVASSNGPWNLAPLAERARYFIEHGPTAIDRGQARLLLDRIDAFQNISVRTQQVTGSALMQGGPVQSASFNSAMQNHPLPNSPQAPAANYEATGWLVPVHAAGPDQPTHALTNDTGDVVAYVSPVAGLNLDRYRNQAVGINGLRGYLPQLQAAHIQAQRVSRIR